MQAEELECLVHELGIHDADADRVVDMLEDACQNAQRLRIVHRLSTLVAKPTEVAVLVKVLLCAKYTEGWVDVIRWVLWETLITHHDASVESIHACETTVCATVARLAWCWRERGNFLQGASDFYAKTLDGNEIGEGKEKLPGCSYSQGLLDTYTVLVAVDQVNQLREQPYERRAYAILSRNCGPAGRLPSLAVRRGLKEPTSVDEIWMLGPNLSG